MSAQSSAFEKELENLSPGNDAQRSLQSRAIAAFTEGAQTRLLLFAQAGGSIPAPFLVILVFWLSAIFVSFTLFAKANLVVMASLLVCAVSFAGAIFLVLELDNPFTGLMGISSATLRSALLPLKSVEICGDGSPGPVPPPGSAPPPDGRRPFRPMAGAGPPVRVDREHRYR